MPSSLVKTKNCSYESVYVVHNLVHSREENSSDNIASYPPDKHHNSDIEHWRGGAQMDADIHFIK